MSKLHRFSTEGPSHFCSCGLWSLHHTDDLDTVARRYRLHLLLNPGECRSVCGHDAYDPDCWEYPRQLCCCYVVHIDELGWPDSDLHFADCTLHGEDA